MSYFSIDHLIVGAFLLITLIIGLRAGRGIKDIREYAIANKQFGTVALVMTFLATDIAGQSILDLAGEVSKTGIIMAVVFIVGVGIAFIIQALFIAPKMVYFNKCITMGDVMGTLYGTNSKIIAGLLGFFTAICVAGMEVTVLGLLCESLLGIDYRWGVGLGGLLLAVYSAHGGIKAVTVTDIFQFLVLFAVIPIVSILALQQAGGIKVVFTQIPSTTFQIIQHPNFSYYLTLFLFKVIFHFYMIDPALIQRLLMGKSRLQLRNQFLALSAFSPALYITTVLIGLAGLVLYPNFTGTQVVPQVIKDVLPVGVKGLAIAGLFAVTMSTIDSFLHAAGLTFVHDVVKPLCDKNNLAINELRWAKYATVFVSLFAIAIGLAKADDLYGLLFTSIEFTGPLLAFPLFGGIMGLKPDKQAFYIASGVTVVAFLLAKPLLPAAHEHLVPLISVLINGLVFSGMHVVRNKGFAIIDRTKPEEYLLHPRRKTFLARLKQWLPIPSNLVQHSQKRIAKYGAPYILLGVFGVINYIVPYFMWEHENPQTYELMTYMRVIGAMAYGLLVVKDKWPQSLLPYLPTFWHLTLLYCLPFTSTLMFLLTQGSVEWLINVAVTIMFLIVLVDWLSFLILTALGISLGFLFYRLAIGPVDLQLDFSSGYLLVYQGVFATLIGLLFARRKQQRVDKQQQTLINKDAANQASLLQVAEEKIKALKTLQSTGVQGLLQVAKDLQALPVEGEVAQKLHTIEATLIPMAFQLQGIDTRAQDYLRLQVASVPMKQWLTKVQENLREKGIYQPMRCQQTTQHKELVCDPERLTTLLLKSIAALGEQPEGHQEEEQQPLLLGLEDTWLHYPLPDVAEGYVKKVKALRMVVTTADSLPALVPCYWPDLTTAPATTPENTQVLDQLANERIIKAHYGYAEVAPNTLLYVIPIDVQEVRPKDMDKRHMELGVAPVRANDHYKSAKVDAQAQEKEFLAAVAQRSSADIGLVKTALELIKWYHGPMNRHSGEPFYLHPLTVAQIVLDYNTDQATILGALLHDTVEDTMMFLQHIGTVFGEDTAGIVDVVTHLQSVENSLYKIRLSAEENLQMLERTGNTRGLYVKLADRMHNMRTIDGHSSLDKQKQIAQETLAFFVPLAKRLGLHEAAQELEERSKEVLMKGTH